MAFTHRGTPFVTAPSCGISTIMLSRAGQVVNPTAAGYADFLNPLTFARYIIAGEVCRFRRFH